MAHQEKQGLTETISVGAGLFFGAGSFMLGYFITMVMVALAESEEFTNDLIETAGWLYYNAQIADLDVSYDRRVGALSDGVPTNYLTEGGDSGLELPVLLYHVVPIIVLLVFGFALARYLGANTIQDGALIGATLVFGTHPLSYVGTYAFTLSEDEVSVAPLMHDSILFVGLLFPVVLGAIGGALSTEL